MPGAPLIDIQTKMRRHVSWAEFACLPSPTAAGGPFVSALLVFAVGFALGYAVRAYISRRRYGRRAGMQNNRLHNSQVPPNEIAGPDSAHRSRLTRK